MSFSNEDLLHVSAMQGTTERDIFDVEEKSVRRIHLLCQKLAVLTMTGHLRRLR